MSDVVLIKTRNLLHQIRYDVRPEANSGAMSGSG